ncbi:hypothetical protein HELRODRAFT_185580 [Helobdella robusta]|uniref:J domain-containing protein n=1 Tax=Helobdella robusta TaxID=6412 RepID=T1FN02_HELRO|nr:hypothetical protein HELRODRAFT_185580 [Helobdella robusta]ESO04760.1 hypothetical protein HELRODRAFT_185580 [Helobdella robusta]
MSNSKAIDLSKYDLYELLNVPRLSSEKLVKKAYRKQALKLHPDKNPNNPKAAEQFQLLQKAFELLSDPVQKDEYDRVIKAKEQAEQKRREMDAVRKRFADKLVADEAKVKKQKEEEDAFKLQEELIKQARLNAEREREAEEERDRLKRKLMKESKMKDGDNEGGYNVKVKWKPSPGHGYDEKKLKAIFSKYGAVRELILPANKKGLCLVQYAKQCQAVTSLDEAGLPSCPMKVTLMFQVQPEHVDDFDSFEQLVLKNMQNMSGSSKNNNTEKNNNNNNDDDDDNCNNHLQDGSLNMNTNDSRNHKNKCNNNSFANDAKCHHTCNDYNVKNSNRLNDSSTNHGHQTPPTSSSTSSRKVDRGRESVLEMEMRRQEERRKIIEQMMQDDLNN